MDQLERRLRASLAAREPDADFADAVLARVRQRAGGGSLAVPRARPSWRMAGALAATVLAAAAGLHWHAERQRAAEARDQLMLALAITSSTLDEVQQKLLRDVAEPAEQENGT